MRISPEARYGEGRALDRDLLRRLWPFLRPHAPAFGLGLALMAGMSAARVAGPYLLKLAVDGPMADGRLDLLFAYAAAYFLLQISEGGLQAAQVLVVRLRGQDVLHALRERLFHKALRLPTRHLDNTPSGQILSRITADVEVLRDLFTSGMAALLGDVLLLVGILVAMALLDLKLALIAYAALPVLAVVSEGFRRLMRRAYRRTRRKTARLTGKLQEFLRGFKILRAFGAQEWAEEEFGRVNAEHRDAFLHSVTLNALFYPAVELVSAFTIALLLWRGSGAVLQEQLTLGVLVAFLEYVQKFFRPVRDLSEKYNVLQSSMAALERIGEFLDLPEVETGGRECPDWDRGVTLQSVRFGYDPAQPVLRGVDLRLGAGEVVAVVGPTGAGKSTLVNLLLDHYRAQDGSVRLGGAPVRHLRSECYRREVAVVPQEPFLFLGTVLDNIRLGRPWVSEKAARSAADAVGLNGTLHGFADGLETSVLEEGSRLSVGQRQLVVFARALAGDPRFLILDEATSEVDQATERLIEQALHALFQGRTSLVVAHRLATVRRADRIVVLSRGTITEQGTHAELLRRDGMYRRLYRLQFRAAAGEWHHQPA